MVKNFLVKEVGKDGKVGVKIKITFSGEKVEGNVLLLRRNPSLFGWLAQS